MKTVKGCTYENCTFNVTVNDNSESGAMKVLEQNEKSSQAVTTGIFGIIGKTLEAFAANQMAKMAMMKKDEKSAPSKKSAKKSPSKKQPLSMTPGAIAKRKKRAAAKAKQSSTSKGK